MTCLSLVVWSLYSANKKLARKRSNLPLLSTKESSSAHLSLTDYFRAQAQAGGQVRIFFDFENDIVDDSIHSIVMKDQGLHD